MNLITVNLIKHQNSIQTTILKEGLTTVGAINIGFPGDLLPVHHTEAMKHVTTPMEMGIGLIRFVNGVVTNDTN